MPKQNEERVKVLHPDLECKDALIRRFENEPVANPPLSLTQYEYKGQAVYWWNTSREP